MRRGFHWLACALALMLYGAPVLAADIAHGKAEYAGICAACHSTSPLNNVYGILAGANNPALIQSFIDNAFPMQQLSYLSPSDVADVAAYLGSVSAPPAIVPQAGYWWNPAEGGRGFTIEQNTTTGNVFFASYLYASGGKSLWYSAGASPMSGSVFSAPMAAFANGQTLTGSYKPATQGTSPGNVSITFSDVSHGTLTWPGGSIPIQRYEFVTGGLGLPPTASQPQTGYWWNPAEGGRGYTIEVQNNMMFVATFMFDATGSPVWYASGPATLSGNNYVGTWTSYSGGETLTGTYHAPTGSTSAGSLTIQFTSPTAGTLTLPDGRQIPIQRYSF